MSPVIYPIKPRTKGRKVSDLQDVLFYLLEHKRDLLAPRPVTTHVPRPPDWREIESGLKRERMKSYFGKTTRWLVTNLQYHLDLPPTGLVDEATANAINALLEEWGLLGDGGEEKQKLVVSGRVVNHELRGVDRLRLRVVDKNIGGDRTLAQGKTGERGAYEIRYAPQKIQRGKRKPDIQVLALGEDGEILAASAVRYNAGPQERGLDIVIPAEKLPSPPEFPRLQTALTPYLGRRGLADLQEDDEHQDITYLANKTGWDARMVAMMALAHQFGQEAEVEPEFFYALFRAGIPASPSLLARTPPETIRRIWKDAIEKEVLPKAFAAKIDATLERFKRYASGRLLAAPADIGVSGIGQLLEISSLGGSEREKIAVLYYEHQDQLHTFWSEVENKLGKDIASRLQLNGRLAFLTLNNAPLIRRLHEKTGSLHAPLDLVRHGFYRQDAWRDLLDEDTPVPDEIPGNEPDEKRANYAAYMAAQLRLSYPTAVISQMVKANEMPRPAYAAVKEEVARFLDEHQGHFELGLQPVAHYLHSHDLDLDAPVLKEIQRLQRVYQITPSNEAMAALLEHNLDSAYAVVRYDEQHFIRTYQGALGGEARARLVYHKAQQVHNAVLNIVTAYGLERSAPPIYAMPWKPMGGQLEGEAPGVLAYPTLEALFGEMDYCACEHCRSWLSPAAYLVDLLQFLDTPDPEKGNPLDVLLQRRPDIQHLQLTCENTNTVLPYVDLVNEILEYWVANDSLSDFKGHDMEEDVTTEELLASPQFVDDSAYERLKEELFPPPLPFHRDLEASRRYFAHFDTPLYQAMERLRIDDSLERGSNNYGWKDILMERLGLSRQEHAILTDSATPLFQLYGEPSDNHLIESLSKAKKFSRKLGLSYQELIDIVRTGFINPHSHLLPRLEKLHVSFATIQDFLDGTLSEQDFSALLPEDLDEAAYGGDVQQWLQDHAAQIMALIVLTYPENGDVCSFDTVELRYAYPDFERNRLRPIEFLKLLRFVRLWRKLGWDIEQTDKAIQALYPQDQVPSQEDGWETARTKLDNGFDTLLVRLAHLQAVMEALGLQPNRDLSPLLACWAPIDTGGYDSLYRRMFLNLTILDIDAVFREDGYGNYLAEKREFQMPGAEPPRLVEHAEALRAAFNLTQEEFDRILQELDFNEATVLDLANVSAVFRHGYLARKLRLSVREFLTIKGMSGLDPFAPLDLEEAPADAPFDSVQPQAIRFLALARQIEGSPFKVSELAYYLKHEDWSGKASPSQESMLSLARTLRSDLLRIDQENSVQEDPTGEVTKAKMALVYDNEATDAFFGLLNNTSVFSVAYAHPRETLEEDIRDVTDRITYDDFQKRLFFRGVMTDAEKTDLDAAPSATNDFRNAVQSLFDAGQEASAVFFERYPDLKGLYVNFMDSSDPVEKRMSALLAEILPDLRAKLKRQLVRETISAKVGADLALVTLLLEDASLIHAVGDPDKPTVRDFTALGTQGLSCDIFFAEDTAGETPDQSTIVASINFGADDASLPTDPTDSYARVSGVWRGFLEAPDNGLYNFYIEADPGAGIALELDGKLVALALNNGVWKNQEPIELNARRLYALKLTAKRVKERLVLKWERRGMGRRVIPAEFLYPATVIERFEITYLRLLKALTIAEALALSGPELTHFIAHSDDYKIDGESWLNALPVEPLSDEAVIRSLFGNVLALLDYRNVKKALQAGNDLLTVLRDPEATEEDGTLLLERVTGWGQNDCNALLPHFGLTLPDLSHLPNFVRMYRAFEVIKVLGVGAGTLIRVTTNDPDADTLRDLQAALRARYDDQPGPRTPLPPVEEAPARRELPQNRAWLKLIQPINDELRARQRDALITYVLHALSQNSDTKYINTPDKLFEYFLIDVEMDPCMKTSRIKQAISSVQLFIQRCLMNLEPDVASSDVNANEWQWMKRYRVWEANRKVFLWPENWLEPELRDNKSPFFRELESELLQGDITEDAAAKALGHYLEKLDEVAKLEVCGLYYEENDLGNEADDVVHVIARTAGARRTYYYRRQEGGITWTPWEKIDLNIEDDPVMPVVWKGRLLLFWVSVLQEAPPETGPAGNEASLNLTQVKPSELRGVAGETKTQVSLLLYWSEYYNGKWQPARTSDVNHPLSLDEFPATGDRAFDRGKLKLWSVEGEDGELKIMIEYPDRSPVRVLTKHKASVGLTGTTRTLWREERVRARYYRLYNTHSLPVTGFDFGVDQEEAKELLTYQGALSCRKMNLVIRNRPILTAALPPCEVVFPHHVVQRSLQMPFFFQDQRHVFFVQTEESRVLVARYPDMVIRPAGGGVGAEISRVTIPDYRLHKAGPVSPAGPIQPWEEPEIVRSRITAEPIAYRLAADGTIRYGNSQIGPAGGIRAVNMDLQ